MTTRLDDPIAKAYDAQLMRRLLTYLRPYKGRVAAAFGLIVAMFGTLFAVPLSYTSLIVLQDRLRRRFPRRAAPALPPAEGGARAGTVSEAREAGAKIARVAAARDWRRSEGDAAL